MPRNAAVSLSCLLLALAAACQTDPVTGKAYYSPLGNDFESQDRFIRERFLTQIQVANDGGLLPEPQIYAACEKVFADVARAVPPRHRRGFQYYFYLSTSPQINAYTYGGGRVHCHLGILARCQDVSEFAGLMAHEIGHNSHDHFGQGIGRSAFTGALERIGGIAGSLGRDLAASLGGVVSVQFTRAQEREADDRGVDYEAAAGYDPDGLARFFDALERDFGSDGAEFFRTHPHPENRVKAIRTRIAKEKLPAGKRTDPEFQKALERAREVLPYYEALYDAMAKEDAKALLAAADAGIERLPHHAQFHFWRGVVLEGNKLHGPAIVALRRADALDETNIVIPLVRSAVEFNHANWAEAEDAASDVLAIIPTVPGAYLIRGVARVKLGREEEGYRDLDLLMRALPKNRKALLEEIHKHVPEYTYPR